MPLVLVPVLFAVVVFGQLEHTRLVLDAAAAAGARQAAVTGEDDATVRSRIATELSDGGLNPLLASVAVTPAIASWGSPITVTVSTTEHVAIPFLGAWAVPMTSDFVARSEVTH